MGGGGGGEMGGGGGGGEMGGVHVWRTYICVSCMSTLTG